MILNFWSSSLASKDWDYRCATMPGLWCWVLITWLCTAKQALDQLSSIPAREAADFQHRERSLISVPGFLFCRQSSLLSLCGPGWVQTLNPPVPAFLALGFIFTVLGFYSFKIRFILCVLPEIMYVHHVCAWCPWRSEEGVGSPGPGVKDGYEPLFGC